MTSIICLCGDSKPKILTKHRGPLIIGNDTIMGIHWVIAPSKMPGARTQRKDRRIRHDKPFEVQVFSPPSWSRYTWMG